MAYNFNANQFYSKPNQGFQPRNVGYAPAFGHQVSATPYYPANAYGLPAAQALPLPRNVIPLAPLPPLPAPGQFLSPPNSSLPAGVNAPFRMNTTVGSGQSLPTPKPQVQQYFYTLPGVKEPASRKKSIKKFLLITSAVVTGVFATAASVLGLMWMFWPGFVELGRNIGPKGALKAANAIKEWKKPGPLLQRMVNSYHAYTQQSESSTQTGWQRIKNWLRPTSTKAPEKVMSEKKEAGNVLADMVNAFSAEEENIDALTVLLKKLGLDLEKLTSSKNLADVINQVDSEKVTAILKSLLPDILKELKPQLDKLTSSENLVEVINDVIKKVEPEKVTAVLEALMPKDAAEILAAARAAGSTSQLAEDLWNLLKKEQKTDIYNQLSRIVTQSIDEYAQSFWKSSPSTSPKPPPVNPGETSPKDVILNTGVSEFAQFAYSFWKTALSKRPPSVSS